MSLHRTTRGDTTPETHTQALVRRRANGGRPSPGSSWRVNIQRHWRRQFPSAACPFFHERVEVSVVDSPSLRDLAGSGRAAEDIGGTQSHVFTTVFVSSRTGFLHEDAGIVYLGARRASPLLAHPEPATPGSRTCRHRSGRPYRSWRPGRSLRDIVEDDLSPMALRSLLDHLINKICHVSPFGGLGAAHARVFPLMVPTIGPVSHPAGRRGQILISASFSGFPALPHKGSACWLPDPYDLPKTVPIFKKRMRRFDF